MKVLPCPACRHSAVIPYSVRFFRFVMRRSDLFVCIVCEARTNYDRMRTWAPAETFVSTEQM